MKRLLSLLALLLLLTGCAAEPEPGLKVTVRAEGVYSVACSTQYDTEVGQNADHSALKPGFSLHFSPSQGKTLYTVSVFDAAGNPLASAQFTDEFSDSTTVYLEITEDLDIIRAETTPEGLALMQYTETENYVAILWEGRTYVPFCAIENSSRGKQIGIVGGDERDQVYAYKGYSTEEWIISFYHSGLMDVSMLMRESHMTEIPDGLESEYAWN